MSQKGQNEHLDLTFTLDSAMKDGREKVRGKKDAPIVQRMLKIYHTSRVGLLSRRASDYSHYKWCEGAEYIAYKLSLYRVRRRLSVLSLILGGLFIGYV